MRRSSSPRFGDLVFQWCSPDEFQRCVRLSSAFRQEGMGSGIHSDTLNRKRCASWCHYVEEQQRNPLKFTHLSRILSGMVVA